MNTRAHFVRFVWFPVCLLACLKVCLFAKGLFVCLLLVAFFVGLCLLTCLSVSVCVCEISYASSLFAF